MARYPDRRAIPRAVAPSCKGNSRPIRGPKTIPQLFDAFPRLPAQSLGPTIPSALEEQRPAADGPLWGGIMSVGSHTYRSTTSTVEDPDIPLMDEGDTKRRLQGLPASWDSREGFLGEDHREDGHRSQDDSQSMRG
jgi:hypothetical protein